jgi:hypothetical protein
MEDYNAVARLKVVCGIPHGGNDARGLVTKDSRRRVRSRGNLL